MSWRKQQLQQYYNGNAIIEQDSCLIEFVKKHSVEQLCFVGENDFEYFSDRLPGVSIDSISNHRPNFMLAIFKPNPYVNFENFLNDLTNYITNTLPSYLYVAINKYAITTQQSWENLTDNYDADLLNILSNKVALSGYCELTRSYQEDRGQYFNFAHPTTNAYYERINRTNN
jgi:hypothetical protein